MQAYYKIHTYTVESLDSYQNWAMRSKEKKKAVEQVSSFIVAFLCTQIRYKTHKVQKSNKTEMLTERMIHDTWYIYVYCCIMTCIEFIKLMHIHFWVVESLFVILCIDTNERLKSQLFWIFFLVNLKKFFHCRFDSKAIRRRKTSGWNGWRRDDSYHLAIYQR